MPNMGSKNQMCKRGRTDRSQTIAPRQHHPGNSDRFDDNDAVDPPGRDQTHTKPTRCSSQSRISELRGGKETHHKDFARRPVRI